MCPYAIALLVLAFGFCNPFSTKPSSPGPPHKSSRHTTLALQSGNSCPLPARIGKKEAATRKADGRRRPQVGSKRRAANLRDQSLKGESRQRAPSMESSISRTELNCISLADPDIQKSVALLKQVRGSFLIILIITILVNRCPNSRKL